MRVHVILLHVIQNMNVKVIVVSMNFIVYVDI